MIEGTPSLAYWEWSAPPGSDINDMASVRLANPAFETRVNHDYLSTQRELLNDEEWAREILGIFPDEDDAPQWRFVTEAAYLACDAKVKPTATGWLTGTPSLSVEMDRDRKVTTIAACGDVAGGKPGMQILARLTQVSDVVPHLLALTSIPDRPFRHLVRDPRSPAGGLDLAPLEAAGVTVTEIKAAELVKVTGQFTDAINEGTVAIRRSSELDESVAGASTRKHGDSLFIDRWADGDPSALIAVDLAYWGHLNAPAPAPEPDFFVI